jgi:hypothetical protein
MQGKCREAYTRPVVLQHCVMFIDAVLRRADDNTTEIKHRIYQTRKAINALNSIWLHKDITKKQKIYIFTKQ